MENDFFEPNFDAPLTPAEQFAIEQDNAKIVVDKEIANMLQNCCKPDPERDKMILNELLQNKSPDSSDTTTSRTNISPNEDYDTVYWFDRVRTFYRNTRDNLYSARSTKTMQHLLIGIVGILFVLSSIPETQCIKTLPTCPVETITCKNAPICQQYGCDGCLTMPSGRCTAMNECFNLERWNIFNLFTLQNILLLLISSLAIRNGMDHLIENTEDQNIRPAANTNKTSNDSSIEKKWKPLPTEKITNRNVELEDPAVYKKNVSYKEPDVQKLLDVHQTEPERTEPERTEPAQTEPERTEPERTEPARTEPERTEPERTESKERKNSIDEYVSRTVFDPDLGIVDATRPEMSECVEKYRNEFVTRIVKNTKEPAEPADASKTTYSSILRPMKQKVKIVPFKKGCSILPKCDYVNACNESKKEREKIATKIFGETPILPPKEKSPEDLLKDAFRAVEDLNAEKYGNVIFTEEVLTYDEQHDH